MQTKEFPHIVMLGLVAIAGAMLLLITTRNSIGTSPDSVVYIGAAQNILDDRGLKVPYGEQIGTPLIHHAPLYPVTLAFAGLVGMELLVVARSLSLFLFVANILLVGLLIRGVTRQAIWLPTLGGLLILTSLTMLTIHAYAWTEPLFILLAFSGLWLLAAYWQNGRYPLLILSAILIGLAVLTRYAGLSLVATGGLGILLFAPVPWRRRLLDGVVFGVVSLVPFAMWSVRNQLLADAAAGGRQVAFHPIGMSHFWQAVFTLTNWLHVPNGVPGELRVLVILTMFVGLVRLLWWGYRADTAVPNLLKLLLLFIIVYPAFLAFSISFFDANTPLDDRILSPLYVAGVVLVLAALARLPDKVEGRWLTAILILVAVLFVGTAVWREVRWIEANAGLGLGFSARAWQQSDLLAEVRQLPDDTPLFSNVPEAVYLHTGKSALSLPRQFNPVAQMANTNYDRDMATIRQQIAQNGGVIVYFHALRPEAEQIINDLAADLPLITLLQTSDGSLFVAASEERTRK